jgi:hypothetical protein
VALTQIEELIVISVKRDIYLTEFKNFLFLQRLYYVWANEIQVEDININVNPLKWCLLDLIKVVYIPILYLVIIPIVVFPSTVYQAHKLKTKYDNCDDATLFFSNQLIIEKKET